MRKRNKLGIFIKGDPLIELTCKICGKQFFVYPCHAKGRKKYCSWECRNKSLKEHMLKNRQPTPFREKHWNWKGGITKRRTKIWKGKKYQTWRNAVFERDNFTCQDCHKRGGDLEAHHIKSWEKYPKLRYVISNGKTLCVDCHNLTKGKKTCKTLKLQ